jgi:long-chain fatty acid transport protein
MKKKLSQVLIISACSYAASISTAFGAGFEKVIMWSGHYAGIAGAATSNVSGAESLFFNPAGLGGNDGISFSINASPSFIKFNAPIVPNSGSTESERTTFIPASALLSYPITPSLGLGLGYFVSGGLRSNYPDINFGFPNLRPTLRGNLTISEASLGLGYELLDGLKIGAAYRMVRVSGELTSARGGTVGGVSTLGVLSYTDLAQTRWNGFKFGAQYAPKNSIWGLGAQWRTQVDFNASGNVSGQFTSSAAPGTTIQLSPTTATVGSTFPHLISLSGYVDPIPNDLRFFLQYDFAKYTDNRELSISGPALTGTGLAAPIQQTSVPLNWSNMNVVRAALEYRGMPDWAFRGGYIYTSQVTPNSNPAPTFSSPGTANTFVVGAGTTIIPGISGDFAFEYSRASGTVAAGEPVSPSLPGDYSSNVFAFHLGATLQL